jgi:predicted ferric reductase
LLIFTFFVKFPYKAWKITHKFLGLTFFFAVLHTFLIPSDVSLYWPLKIYMTVLVILGLITLFYRTLFGNMFPKKFKYVVDEIKKLNDRVIEISMSAVEDRMEFKAGQYIFISFKKGGLSREIHPFSISSGISDKKLRITVKSLGRYTARLQNLKLGTIATIEGPFGVFSYLNTSNKNQVWIAGGIGITPFLSMARSLTNQNYKIDVYYCVKTKSEMVFFEELEKISSQNRNLRIIPICSDTRGRLNTKTINSLSGNILGKDFFLCGPPAMMKSMKSILLEGGIPNRNIHSEEFTF